MSENMRNPFVYSSNVREKYDYVRVFIVSMSFRAAPFYFSFLSHFYIIAMLSQDVGEKSTIPFFVHLVIRWKFINLHPPTF